MVHIKAWFSLQNVSTFLNVKARFCPQYGIEIISSLSQLLRHGVGLSTGTDSELITQLLTHTPDCGEPNGANWVGR